MLSFCIPFFSDTYINISTTRVRKSRYYFSKFLSRNISCFKIVEMILFNFKYSSQLTFCYYLHMIPHTFHIPY